jgi:hypothetical protein
MAETANDDQQTLQCTAVPTYFDTTPLTPPLLLITTIILPDISIFVDS